MITGRLTHVHHRYDILYSFFAFKLYKLIIAHPYTTPPNRFDSVYNISISDIFYY